MRRTSPPRPETLADEPAAPAAATSSIPPDAKWVATTASEQLQVFSRRSEQRGTLWIGQMDGNGGRDVVVYVPPDPDPKAEVQLVYHFHGTYGERMVQRTSGVPKKAWVGWDRLAQTMDAVDQLQRQRPYNVALVYPISSGKRLEPGHRGWSNVMYDRMWMRPAEALGYRDGFDELHEETVELLAERFSIPTELLRSQVVAEGHSAGGIALLNVAETTKRTPIAEYIFLDASFQGWADGCYRAVKASGSVARISIVLTDRGIADPHGKRDPWCVTTPREVAKFDAVRPWCDDRPQATPPGFGASCEELEALARDWTEQYAPWCAALRGDMADIEEVYLHRTRVPHGKQPRHFSGGLELPPDRFTTSGDPAPP